MEQEQKPPGQEPSSDKISPSITVTNKKGLSKRLKITLIVVGVVVLIVAVAFVLLQLGKEDTKENTSTLEESDETSLEEQNFEGALELDPSKNYGDAYADGILPVGDDKYTTDGAKKGHIYMCNANFVSDQQAGATTRGPWFVGTMQWDVNKK